MTGDLIDELSSILGGGLLVGEQDRRTRARDYWVRSEIDQWQGRLDLPTAVAAPATVAEMVEVVALCRARSVPIVTRGAGSGVVGGVLASPDGIVVSTERLVGGGSVDDVDLVATFGAGTLGIDAENRVQAGGCTIGHWPQSIDRSTVGGWVATRASGQYSTAYGNIEDVVHSLEAVLPDGSVYRSRATPRAASGPDLRHLLIGSEGTLGIITEVTFSLRPLPEPGVRQAFHFADMATGIDAVRSVVVPGWRPPVVRLYDPRESRRHFGEHVPKGRCVVIFLHEGPPGHAPLEAAAVADLCRAAGGEAADPSAVDRWFDVRNDVPSWTELFEQGLLVDTIEVATGWRDLARLYHAVADAVGAVPGVIAATAHSSHAYRSGANLYFTFAAQPAEPSDFRATYDACWQAAMTATTALGAGIAHHHGIGRVRRDWLVHELGPAGVELLRAVKRALDPDDLMNPGVLVPADRDRVAEDEV
ncbi:MAG: FAD-binding oxidoreductase [Acidimicrobiales bacterium]